MDNVTYTEVPGIPDAETLRQAFFKVVDQRVVGWQSKAKALMDMMNEFHGVSAAGGKTYISGSENARIDFLHVALMKYGKPVSTYEEFNNIAKFMVGYLDAENSPFALAKRKEVEK